MEHVSKVYDPEGAAFVAVDDASMHIAPGELRVIVGPSGCGKSTFLNAIAGFHSISSGEIWLDDELLCGPNKPQAKPGADRVVVFQHNALFPWKTVLDNVTYGPIVQERLSKKEARDLGRERMEQAGLAGLEDRYPSELSSGMQRRVEIVRALVNDPKVLLLDEPFRGMDSLTKSVMHESLLEIFDKNKVTVMFITHDIDEAVFLGDKVSVMSTRPGRIKETIEVDIPRPRDYHVLTSPRFRELMAGIHGEVEIEARKAFEAGEREMA
ncbi:MAG: ABC transporter ATP-binding protein [Actinomycetota bacterium]|nr:ABC transporter ATP-binding protein [Actinomycetota bacterium]